MEHSFTSIMRRTIFRLFAVIVILLSIGNALSFSQGNTTPDSKGRDFWFCYMPNYHTPSQGVDRSDSLYMFVVAERPTNVEITYRNIRGQTFTRTFAITNTNTILSFATGYDGFELLGWNFDQTIDLGGRQTQRIAPQSYHITATDDVTIYALSQAYLTSDAFLVLPTDAVAQDYLIMAYYADASQDQESAITPSQFAIVATENGTSINIKTALDVPTFNGSKELNIILNQGDVYLVQTPISKVDYDLTGTRITSSKPIAVFSGQQRAKVPFTNANDLQSRDILIEQLPPITTWGRTALLVPYEQPFGTLPIGTDVYRIIAANDSTIVQIAGLAQPIRLDAGEWVENPLLQPASVTSNNPIMVAQYKKTHSPSSVSVILVGDPFMMIIPPQEQFMNSYRCINVQVLSREINSNGVLQPVYVEQKMTVVLPRVSINSLRIDGATVPNNLFRNIPGSDYVYAGLTMQDGVHTVSADTGVGIYVYGFGAANSYGYVGGMAFRRYDFNPPRIVSKQSCFEIEGSAFDTTTNDSKIISFTVTDSSNIRFSGQIFSGGDSLQFTASIIDSTKEGIFTLSVRDSAGFVNSKKYTISGFTLRSVDSPNLPNRVDIVAPVGVTRCTTVQLKNQGTLPFVLKSSQLINGSIPGLTITSPIPSVIAPGAVLNLTFCYKIPVAGIYTTDLFIESSCFSRVMLKIMVDARPDTMAPTITSSLNDCKDAITINVSDNDPADTGLDRIIFSDTVNITSTIIPSGNSAVINIRQSDWRLDSRYTITVVDSANNRITQTREIEGFTVMYTNIDSARSQYAFDSVIVNTFECDTISLYNYGKFPKSYDNLLLENNTVYSIPQHQLPIILAPGDSVRVALCYNPRLILANDSLLRDTMRLWFGCNQRPLYLSGKTKPLIFETLTSCNALLVGATSNANLDNLLLNIAPNPVVDKMVVRMNFTTSGIRTLSIRSMFGAEIQSFTQMYNAGVYDVQFPSFDMPAGMYSVLVSDGKSLSSKQFMFTR